MREDVALNSPGKSVFLLGNEAIARGFIEGGLHVASAYPGTPSTEIMETLISVRKEFSIYTEWSVNEKVAAEVAIAASLCGLRSMCSMKGVGVNVASEPFQAFTYMGAEGGIVLVSADDPSLHSSHTEQDSRLFARQAYMPVFEPSDANEAKEMARASLELSEKWRQPVLLRTTTLISHSSGKVVLGKIGNEKRTGEFKRNPQRWVNLPANARRMRKELIERLDKIAVETNSLDFNRIENTEAGGKIGIIACGVTYRMVRESLALMKMENTTPVLKVGTPYPLPEKLIEKFLTPLEKVLVVEEVEPLVEMQVALAANRLGINVKISGKDILPRAGEIKVREALEGICRFTGKEMPPGLKESDGMRAEATALVPPRPPILCPGCGHRAAFYAINVAERKMGLKTDGGIIKPSDIGCYTLGFQAPLHAVDTHFCMGGGIGVSNGFSKVVGQRVVATIGDSTFFHAGIPPLINAVFNKNRLTLIILDNGTTAMTGHQTHPGVGRTAAGDATKKLAVEGIAKACGVEMVKVADIFSPSDMINALVECLNFDGPSVLVAKGPCALMSSRKKADGTSFQVDREKCKKCMVCIEKFGCPAFYLDGDKMNIDENQCTGCGVCSDKSICAAGAIKKVEGRGKRKA